ncbi:MAG: type I phosphomannose isomerase catalytic subunit, partial [Acutalibacteraceae bacterium]
MKILKLRPAVKDYIWGGNRLSKEFDIESDYDKQAEAWVLSCHDDGENIIQGGPFDGRTLKDVLENEGKDFLGTNCEKFDFFPI